MQLIAVASGKGGVGKSLISANLAIALAQAGKDVVLADLDLGGSNLHLILGQMAVSAGVGSFLQNSKINLEDIIYPTGYENLRFIPGESELPGVANIRSGEKNRLIRHLTKLECDYLILDLGAGTSFNTMDFFLLATCGIMVTTPTLTSTLNAYLFLKNAVFRVLNSCITRNSPVHDYMEGLRKDGISLQKIHVGKLLENIKKLDMGVYEEYIHRTSHIRPRLVMNMLEDPKDAKRANKLKISSRQYLGLEMEHLGVVYRDDLQNLALNSQLPILVYKPQSILSQAIYRMADKILEMEDIPVEPLALGDGEESFLEAAYEAELDFANKQSSLEELLHCGALTQGDLIETIKMQQYELTQLKKENRLIKHKLTQAIQAGFDGR
ncbi:MAG: P-loop NTPase [Spirochaetales bacterium]|nr:P-loop NTPase [Spirochaetales bacterium]